MKIESKLLTLRQLIPLTVDVLVDVKISLTFLNEYTLSQQAMQVQMMENNIDFTSDDPMDQKGLNFELEPSSDSKLILNKKSSPLKIGEKRKLEEIQNSAAAADQQDQKPVTKKMKISASDKNPVIFSGFLNTFFPFSFLHFSFFFLSVSFFPISLLTKIRYFFPQFFAIFRNFFRFFLFQIFLISLIFICFQFC